MIVAVQFYFKYYTRSSVRSAAKAGLTSTTRVPKHWLRCAPRGISGDFSSRAVHLIIIFNINMYEESPGSVCKAIKHYIKTGANLLSDAKTNTIQVALL